MNTQVPPGPGNAVAPQEYPQFAAGYAQYPPAQYLPGREQPVSAPPTGYPVGGVPAVAYPQEGTAGYPAVGHPQEGAAGYPAVGYPQEAAVGYPAVGYPQEGAAGYPAPVPYPQPSTYPPPSAYSTAPPWATRPADHGAAPAIGPGTPPNRPGTPHEHLGTPPERLGIPQKHVGTAQERPGIPQERPGIPPDQPLPQYGGLLVPFPDEMRHASRAQAPAVWPVAAFTMLFGILGAVSAKRRADQARRTHNSIAPYWIAFLVSVAAGAFCWFVLAAAVIAPMYIEFRETAILKAVQSNVVGDGQLKDARIAVTAAQCRAVTDRDTEGMRDYLCRLTLEGGRTGTLALTADESGQWHSEPTG